MLIISGGVGPHLFHKTTLSSAYKDAKQIQSRLLLTRYASRTIDLRQSKGLDVDRSFDTTQALFTELVTRFVALHGKPQVFKKRAIKEVSITLNALIKAINELSETLQVMKSQLDFECICLHDEAVESRIQEKAIVLEQSRLELNLQNLSLNVQTLWLEMGETRRHQSELEDIVSNEKRIRKNALIDLIPFYGLIEGIITGEPERGIPFYSQVKGIDSAVTEKKEKAEKKLGVTKGHVRALDSEIDGIRALQGKKKDEKSKLTVRINSLTMHISTLEGEINAVGKAITNVLQTRQALTAASENFEYLEIDVKSHAKANAGSIEDQDIRAILQALLPPRLIRF